MDNFLSSPHNIKVILYRNDNFHVTFIINWRIISFYKRLSAATMPYKNITISAPQTLACFAVHIVKQLNIKFCISRNIVSLFRHGTERIIRVQNNNHLQNGRAVTPRINKHVSAKRPYYIVYTYTHDHNPFRGCQNYCYSIEAYFTVAE